jgi:hypothetical protein
MLDACISRTTEIIATTAIKIAITMMLNLNFNFMNTPPIKLAAFTADVKSEGNLEPKVRQFPCSLILKMTIFVWKGNVFYRVLRIL